ncbi:MAG: DUF1552 domain-containing protein [Pirellulales bacterium]
MRPHRRTLLQLAGYGSSAALLSPILSQLETQAAGTAEASLPRRIVFVVQSNGMNPNHLRPEGVSPPKDGRATNDTLEELSLVDRKLHPAIAGLEPFQQRLTLIQGLSGKIALSDHSANHGALGCYPANKGPMAQTIDSALSDVLPGVFKHVALGLSGRADGAMNYDISASGPGKAIPIVCSPALAFSSLFGSVSEGAGRKAFNHKTNLLDFMAADVRRVQNGLAGEERAKFEQYAAAFESLHARQQELLRKAADLKKHMPHLGERANSSTSTIVLEAQFEIAAAALIAGLTNVVTLASGGGGQSFGKFPELNMPDLHGMGHGAAFGRASSEDCFVELRQFHVKLIARLAEQLAAVKEGDGSMLDRTLIVYLSDSGESHHPNLQEWPVILLGDLGGKLNSGGRFLQFPRYGGPRHKTMANLYCTLLHAAGRPRDQFGVADPGLKDGDQTGPLPELLS